MIFYNAIVNNFSYFTASVVGMTVMLCLLRIVAIKVGLVDHPNSRKIHVKPVPLVGGMALFFMMALLLLFSSNVNTFTFYLMLASGMIVIIGLLDDLYQLSALWRFLVQILACLIMIYFAQVQLKTFGFLLSSDWEVNLGLLAIPVTVFGVVGIINALNMADGIDGLAALTYCLPVLVLLGISGQSSLNLWLLMSVVCVFVFVFFNKSSKYKVFLGDCGSLLLGFILSWLLVFFSQGDTAVIKPVSALYMVALPLYDTIFVMLKRILGGKSPFKPDKTHLHHLFLARGWSQNKVLLTMLVLQSMLIFIGVGFLVIDLSESYQFYWFVIMSAIYYYAMNKIWAATDLLRE